MLSVWDILYAFCAGCVCGFFFYGCIDWKNNNWHKLNKERKD